MTILHLSDTHGLHKDLTALPPTDVVIHSGDVSRGDEQYQLKNKPHVFDI